MNPSFMLPLKFKECLTILQTKIISILYRLLRIFKTTYRESRASTHTFQCVLYATRNFRSFQTLYFKIASLMVFSFLPKNVHFISKNSISCLFQQFSRYKRVLLHTTRVQLTGDIFIDTMSHTKKKTKN